MKRIIKGSAVWPLADKLLGEWLGDRTEVGLSEALGGLNHAAEQIMIAVGSDVAKIETFIVNCLAGAAGANAVSRLLRARGFRKAGMKGSALTYDRQPLYRKAPA